jgi:hypothetical protein
MGKSVMQKLIMVEINMNEKIMKKLTMEKLEWLNKP